MDHVSTNSNPGGNVSAISRAMRNRAIVRDFTHKMRQIIYCVREITHVMRERTELRVKSRCSMPP